MDNNMNFGNIHDFNRTVNKDINNTIDFTVSSNSIGVSRKGMMALNRELPNIGYASDKAAYKLKLALESKYKVPSEGICIANSSKELMSAIISSNEFKKAYVIEPDFSEEIDLAKNVGLKLEYLTLNEDNSIVMNDNLSDLNNELVILGNPSNPKGELLNESVLMQILDSNKDGLVVVDESAIDFVGEQYSFRRLIAKFDNLIIIHSLAEFYAIPGLGGAAAYMDSKVADIVKSCAPNETLNCLAQTYLANALTDSTYYHQSQAFVKIEKTRLEALYNFLEDVEFAPTMANYFLLKVKKASSVTDLIKHLAIKNIYLVDCASYPKLGEDFIKVAIKSRDDNNYLFQAIKEFFYG